MPSTEWTSEKEKENPVNIPVEVKAENYSQQHSIDIFSKGFLCCAFQAFIPLFNSFYRSNAQWTHSTNLWSKPLFICETSGFLQMPWKTNFSSLKW